MADERDAANTIAPGLLYLIMALMLIFGTCNTVVMKAQDDHVIYESDDPVNPTGKAIKYNHPFF
jgi:hypothetical protein